MNLLLTEGGTPLDAMQRYAPISERWILWSISVSPDTVRETIKDNANFDLQCIQCIMKFI